MQTTLAALAVIAVGYLLAYLVFNRLRDRFGYVGGAEYVIIGFLLGPRVTGLLGAAQVQDLTPIVSLGLGWLGMLLGTYFRIPSMALIPAEHLRAAFTEAFSTFLFALLVLLLLFHIVGYAGAEASVQAVSLASVATLSSPAAVDVLTRRNGGSPLLPILQLTARVDALVAVAGFGLILAVHHQGQVAPSVRPPTATEWAVINLALGLACGILFHLFLGPPNRRDEAEGGSRLFVALAGAIVIASGASYYLNLSPIFTNLILGFILANTGGAHGDVAGLLRATERPVYLALLIFAGAAWSPGSRELLFIAPLFVLVRLAARLAGGWAAGSRLGPVRNPRFGRALLAQGGLAVALAINYAQVHPELNSDVVLTAALVSVLLFEIVAGREAWAVAGQTAAESVAK
jgi:hypothetical protein